MPQLGEIRRSRDLGYQNRGSHTWVACLECGKERWFKYRHDKTNICRSCASKNLSHMWGEKNPRWKGGRHEFKDGYIGIKLQSNDPFYPMMNKRGYVLEHRLFMARHLGRCLLPKEVVHHNGAKYLQGSKEDRQDNRLVNLRLFATDSEHQTYHHANRKLKISYCLQDWLFDAL